MENTVAFTTAFVKAILAYRPYSNLTTGKTHNWNGPVFYTNLGQVEPI
jgi:hypothetical protein